MTSSNAQPLPNTPLPDHQAPRPRDGPTNVPRGKLKGPAKDDASLIVSSSAGAPCGQAVQETSSVLDRARVIEQRGVRVSWDALTPTGAEKEMCMSMGPLQRQVPPPPHPFVGQQCRTRQDTPR